MKEKIEDINELKKIASQVRRDILRMVHSVNSGHPGGSLGCTDFFVSLFFSIMERNEEFNINGNNEDIFFLSNGHISPVFYSVLARSGYFDLKELNTFRRINSRLQGHPATHEGLPGVRVASGSLGQGLSVAIGAAQTKKLNNDNKIVFILLGDGELQEGQIWEAIMYAANNKIDNLLQSIHHSDFNILINDESTSVLKDFKSNRTIKKNLEQSNHAIININEDPSMSDWLGISNEIESLIRNI